MDVVHHMREASDLPTQSAQAETVVGNGVRIRGDRWVSSRVRLGEGAHVRASRAEAE